MRWVYGDQLCRLWSLMKHHTIKIGTRGSKLALWQANWVKDTIVKHHPQFNVELVIIKTKGDKILDVPLAKVGGKGLFVKEIEEAMLDRRTDMAVHSMKDMPSEIPPGLCIGAIPRREVANDVLISANGCHLKDLKAGGTVGTSSLRRAAQLLHIRPDIRIVPLRGNLNTRIAKLESEQLDAIILAAAGVKRLGLERKITQYLDKTLMLPAVGQGALCIETRIDDKKTAPVNRQMNDQETRTTVLGERAFLHRLEGGCQVPIAAHGELDKDQFHITGLVAETDGSAILKETISGPKDQSEEIGIALAEKLLSLGARDILDKAVINEK